MDCLSTDKAGLNRMADTLGKAAAELKEIAESTQDPSHVVTISLNLLDLSKVST